VSKVPDTINYNSKSPSLTSLSHGYSQTVYSQEFECNASI
jgi:hypothetical protein